MGEAGRARARAVRETARERWGEADGSAEPSSEQDRLEALGDEIARLAALIQALEAAGDALYRDEASGTHGSREPREGARDGSREPRSPRHRRREAARCRADGGEPSPETP